VDLTGDFHPSNPKTLSLLEIAGSVYVNPVQCKFEGTPMLVQNAANGDCDY